MTVSRGPPSSKSEELALSGKKLVDSTRDADGCSELPLEVQRLDLDDMAGAFVGFE
jgi:hypothetical protein